MTPARLPLRDCSRAQHDAWPAREEVGADAARTKTRPRPTADRAGEHRAADDVLETDLQSDEILACFEEALGERQPEMGTDAAAG